MRDPLTAALTPPVTVVVPTRDRPDFLAQALESVRSALREQDRIVVVDSASRSPRVRDVAERAGAQVVRCEESGISRARNAGWRAATTDIVAFTDDDCMPAPGWIAAMSDVFARFPDAAFVTGRVLGDDVVRGHAELNISLFVSERATRFELGDDLREMGHGANMAWRVSALEAIGGFDEELGTGALFRAAEDQDAFWRALRGGKTGRFDPEPVVVHRHWRNRRSQLRTTFGYGVGSGALAVKQRRLGATQSGARTEPCGRSILWGVIRSGWVSFRENVADHVRNRYEMGVVGEAWFLAGFLKGSMKARGIALSKDDLLFTLDPVS